MKFQTIYALVVVAFLILINICAFTGCPGDAADAGPNADAVRKTEAEQAAENMRGACQIRPGIQSEQAASNATMPVPDNKKLHRSIDETAGEASL